MLSDFDYDVLQKKRLTASARRRVCGSKSHRCTLPSDRLTPAQLKRRNGPVSTYKLDAPMGWNAFQSMPRDLQQTYLENLSDLYNANNEMLSQMFGVHPITVSKCRRQLGVHSPGKRMSEDEKAVTLAKWNAFCNGVLGGAPAVQEPSQEVEEVPASPAGPDSPVTESEIVEPPVPGWNERHFRWRV